MSAQASAAISFTMTRKSDTLASFTVNAGSTFGTGDYYDGTNLRLLNIVQGTTSGFTILPRTNSTFSTGLAYIAAADFTPNNLVMVFYGGTVNTSVDPWSYDGYAVGTPFSGSADVDLTGTGLTWAAAGGSGNVKDVSAYGAQQIVGAWAMNAQGGAAPVPEPETWALMLMGTSGLLWRLRRRLNRGPADDAETAPGALAA